VLHPVGTVGEVCATCQRWEADRAADTVSPSGPVAQSGSAPPWHGGGRRFESGQVHPLVESFNAVGFVLGGLVAGEGSFIVTPLHRPFEDGTPRVRFVFQMSLAARDRALLEALRAFVGVGSVLDAPSRKQHWQPTSTYTVGSLKANSSAIVPFGERYLLPSAKRAQFESWRDQLAAYIAAHPKVRRVRSICSVQGCDKLVRGQGLCRSHYYRLTGY
jgi:hypothetical protein